MQNILVICIGNICRSPMAEGLLKEALPGKTINSAGLAAMVSQAADPFSIQIMQQNGIDISTHRARSISARLVSDADLILTMDLEQKRTVETQYPNSIGKVYRLGEFGNIDIGDPYRQGIDSFQAAYELIREGVNVMVKRLVQIG